MFDWTKENILNKVSYHATPEKGDNVIVDSMTDPMSGEEVKRLLIKRDGEYYADRIMCDKKVIRTVGYEGTSAEMTIDFTGAALADHYLYQATLKIKMFNKFLGEYANANWALFGKPILAGFEVGEGASDADLADACAIALNEAIPENNRFMEIEHEEGSTEIKISLPDCYADFESFALEAYDPTACESCLGEYHRVDMDDNIEIVHNVEPFATGAWIRENLRFPSYPNMRYAPLYADEQPVPGAIYVMYSFAYRVEGLPAGLNWAGERAASETRHVFYVLASEDAKFQEALGELDADIVNEHIHTDKNAEGEDVEPMHKNPSDEIGG